MKFMKIILERKESASVVAAAFLLPEIYWELADDGLAKIKKAANQSQNRQR